MKKLGVNRKYVEAQMEGLCRAYTIVKQGNEAGKNGLEELEKEIKFRNVTYTPLSYNKDVIIEYLEHMTENILTATLLLTLAVLRDEFGFGKDRAKRFWQRYTMKTECLRDRAITELSWTDISEQVREELGFDITLDWDAWRNKWKENSNECKDR